jgi:hypothetical protein
LALGDVDRKYLDGKSNDKHGAKYQYRYIDIPFSAFIPQLF